MIELILAPRAITKKEIADKVNQVKELIESGNISALDAVIIAKAGKKLFDDIIKASESLSIVESDMYGDRDKERLGAQFSVTTGRPMYDYEADAEYCRLSKEMKERKALLDQAIKSKATIIDSDGVEVKEVPLKSYAKASLRVNFK
jgi:hypothetical protein